MRLDKFTTKFQEALSDAQSIALGNDHAYIEPVHMLVAMLKQDDGPKALLQRAGANVPGLLAAAEAAGEMPGEVVLVPVCNPIGLDQSLMHHQMARLRHGTRRSAGDFAKDGACVTALGNAHRQRDGRQVGGRQRQRRRLRHDARQRVRVVQLHGAPLCRLAVKVSRRLA